MNKKVTTANCKNDPAKKTKWIFTLAVIAIVVFLGFLDGSGQENSLKARGIGYFKTLGTQPETIVFKENGVNKLRLLVMQPSREGKMGKLPAMVWIHGGAWVAGSPDGFIPHLRWSAAHGTVGIAMQYRLVAKPESRTDPANMNTVEDCLSDCADAIKYIREHSEELGIDPQKIIVIGDSAGGHLALCLGTMNLPSVARANVVINCNGISDMTLEKWIKYISPGEDRFKRAKKLSPVNLLDSKDAPILTLNGGKDQVVTPNEAEAFFHACKEAKIDSEYMLFPDMRHAFIVTGYTATEEQTDRALTSMVAFLVKRNFLPAQ